jgi:hypothetical protein
MSLLLMLSMGVTKEEIIQVIRLDSVTRLSLLAIHMIERNDPLTIDDL